MASHARGDDEREHGRAEAQTGSRRALAICAACGPRGVSTDCELSLQHGVRQRDGEQDAQRPASWLLARSRLRSEVRRDIVDLFGVSARAIGAMMAASSVPGARPSFQSRSRFAM